MRKLDEAGRDHGRPLRGGEGGDLESWRREKEKREAIKQEGIPGGFRCTEVGGRGAPGIPCKANRKALQKQNCIAMCLVFVEREDVTRRRLRVGKE